MEFNLILIRYGELSLKSSYVRKIFEHALVKNIAQACKAEHVSAKILRTRGRIFLETDQITETLTFLKKIFGITSFSPVIQTTADEKEMNDLSLTFAKEYISKSTSFALRVTRTGNHKYSSQDIAIALGNEIVNKTKASVNLSKPDVELFIDIRDHKAFFFTEKRKGPGGLPLGTQGNVVAFIDQPSALCATWHLTKRGCTPIFLAKKSLVDAVHSFCTMWYVTPIISILNPEENDHDQINSLVKTHNCHAVTSGHSLMKDDTILNDLATYKQHLTVPLLSPLLAMDEHMITDQCASIGVLL